MSLIDDVPIIRAPKTRWEKFKAFFSPQVNAAILGWALALVSGAFFLKDMAKVQDLQHDKLSLQTEIGRLTTEKKSAEDRIAFYSSLPFQVPTLVSNLNYFLVNDPTNRQQFAEFFLNLSSLGTNLVNELQSFKPTFDLELNGTNLAPFSVIDSLGPPRIALRVVNTSRITAEHVSVDLIAPLDDTNVIARGWRPQPGGGAVGSYHRLVNGKTEVVRRQPGHWGFDADHSLPNQDYYLLPVFLVTNYDGVYLPLQLGVSADRAAVRRFLVHLMFKEGRDRIIVVPSQDGGWVAFPK